MLRDDSFGYKVNELIVITLSKTFEVQLSKDIGL